jgi:hypothetical protein
MIVVIDSNKPFTSLWESFDILFGTETAAPDQRP